MERQVKHGEPDAGNELPEAIRRSVAWLVFAIAACGFAGEGDVVLKPGRTEVVVAPSARKVNSSVVFAATEMTNFLSRAFGTPVPLVSRPDPAKVAIVLGTNEWSAAERIDVSALPCDASRIRTAPGRVYIAGADGDGFDIRLKGRCLPVARGTLNGVYEFLERFVGCRFYFPGELGEIVPRVSRVKVSATDRIDRPDWTVRHSTHALGAWPDEFTPEQRRLGLQLFFLRMRYQTQSIPCCHGQSLSGFSRRFGKSHPEYFRVTEKGERHICDSATEKRPDDWNRSSVCNSSAIWDEIYADAKSYFRGEGPEVRGMVVQDGAKGYQWGPQAYGRAYYDVMPNDGMHKCFCDSCQAAYARAKDPLNYATEQIWGKVAALGNRLKAEGVPGTLTMMAYTPYRNVPDLEIPGNVAVMVCNNGPWMRGAVREDALANVRAWTEKRKGKVWLWHNTGRYGDMIQKSIDVPSPTPRTFGRHYRSLAPLIFGAYCSNNSPRFLYSALNYYVFYKVAWNTATDADALVDEYNRLMFGPAAKPMGEFFDLLERKWMDEVMGNVEDTPIGMMAVTPSEFRFWSAIYSMPFLRKLNALVSDAERTVRPGSPEARRIALFRREFLTPMIPHARQYDGANSVKREKARRAADPRPSLIGDFKPVTIDVTPAMTNQINHWKTFRADIRPGHRYRLSYFVRGKGLRMLHRWGGVGAVVWADVGKDWTLLSLGAGLCGDFDWICQQGEFEVPKDVEEKGFRPKIVLRVCRAVGTAEFDGLRLEDLGEKGDL